MAIATWQDLCIDANDADRLGHFWATALGLTEVAGLLGETLGEEEATDELLTGLSKKSNKIAVAA